MQIAIVGLAGSGKTTVFNTLTRGHAETGGFGGLELHVGAVKVPDDRLDRLAAIFKPKKIVHADVTYVDLPAPPASSEGRVGTEELPAEHLARLRIHDGEIPKGSRRCASPGAAAFTSGGAAVFVCGTNFHSRGRTFRENALIHEMLHTLGLRENPPSSAEISRRVAERCGS
jgi:hypothetical protein